MMSLRRSFSSSAVVTWALSVALLKPVLRSQVKNRRSSVRYWYEVVREWRVPSWYSLTKSGSCFSSRSIKLRYRCVSMLNFLTN